MTGEDFRIDRHVDRVPIDISVGILRLLLGDEKVDEAYAALDDAKTRPDRSLTSRQAVTEHPFSFLSAYLAPMVAGALGELLNRRALDEVLA